MKVDKKQVFLMILLLIGIVSIADAQSIIIRSKDGTEQDKTLNSLKKFSFVNDNLQLSYSDGSTESYSIPSIEKLYFESLPVGIESLLSSSKTSQISIYPNPVNNMLYFENVTEQNSQLQIYRMDGKLMQQSQIEKGTSSVDVRSLNRGLYFIIINNQALKFMKL